VFGVEAILIYTSPARWIDGKDCLAISRGVSNMVTIYRMNMNDLDDRFLEALRALFKDKEVEITVTEIDETQYLLQGEANRIRLLQAVRNIENGQNLVDVPLDMFQ
jgi:antitoxin YefM